MGCTSVSSPSCCWLFPAKENTIWLRLWTMPTWPVAWMVAWMRAWIVAYMKAWLKTEQRGQTISLVAGVPPTAAPTPRHGPVHNMAGENRQVSNGDQNWILECRNL